MSLSLDKQNAYRNRYASQTQGWHPATEVYEGEIRARLLDGMRVLDIGCGRGGVLEQLGEAVTYPVGIDPDWLSLDEHRMSHLPRTVATADNLPFVDQSFDMVLSSWVLEHLPDPSHTFAECVRILKPGGYFLFITPNKNSLVAYLNRIAKPLQARLVPLLYGREEADTFPVVYRANTPRTLDRLATQTGFASVYLHTIKDPSYLAFHPLLFHMTVGISRITPNVMAEHLVGIYQKQ